MLDPRSERSGRDHHGGSDGRACAAAERAGARGRPGGHLAPPRGTSPTASHEIRKATSGQALARRRRRERVSDCEARFDAVVAQWGSVDILVNNAGTSAAAGSRRWTTRRGRRTGISR